MSAGNCFDRFVLYCSSVKALAMCGVELCPSCWNVAAKKTGILPYYTSRFPVNRSHRGIEVFLFFQFCYFWYGPTDVCQRCLVAVTSSMQGSQVASGRDLVAPNSKRQCLRSGSRLAGSNLRHSLRTDSS